MFLNLLSSRVNKLSIFDLIHTYLEFFPPRDYKCMSWICFGKEIGKKCGFSLRFITSNACLDPPLLIHVFASNFLTLPFYHLHVKVYSVRANSIKSTFNIFNSNLVLWNGSDSYLSAFSFSTKRIQKVILILLQNICF